ncbi:MAG: YbaB/EbfC family nucleoid-associated protein [Clostridiales bacterium]|nr:YbaB/EbfC family nucleoid-associated protein [Clostridiales bacterium]
MKARLPKGYGGGPTDMNSMLRQAQKMQDDMAALQEELSAREYEISAGGGMVTLKITGEKQITELNIKPEVVDPEDIEILEDILTAAFNEAIRKVEETSAAEMEKITGKLNLPGMF